MGFRGIAEHIDCHEVAAGGKSIFICKWNIRVEHNDSQMPKPLVEKLQLQVDWGFADSGVDKLSRLDSSRVESKTHVDCGFEMGKNIRDDAELVYSLGDELVVVLAPFLLCKVPVNGLAHIPWQKVS